MSSIKPTDPRSTPVSPSSPDSVEQGGTERAGGPSFRDALERAGDAGHAQGPGAAATARGPAAADPVAELAQAVRSGALSAEQALERLVERAVSGVGRGLSQAQRAELTVVLRTALESDPALRELRDALK
jgi:hypothetical protein